MRWYVAHTYSGYENKVKTNLEKIVENRGMQDLITDVRIPTEIITEGEGENEKSVESKLLPSYVLVRMIMCDESWHIVRNIRGVTGFVGPGSKPVPLTDEEVESLLGEDGHRRADGARHRRHRGYCGGCVCRIQRQACRNFSRDRRGHGYRVHRRPRYAYQSGHQGDKKGKRLKSHWFFAR